MHGRGRRHERLESTSVPTVRDKPPAISHGMTPSLWLAIATMTTSICGTGAAMANCDNFAPGTGQTATCDDTAPNPATTNVAAAVGSSNVTINIGDGAGLAIARATSPVATSVITSSQINNDGTISVTGGGGTGGNRGAAILGIGNDNVLTNGGQGIITTSGAFNDGMAANGSGNTLTNNGTITTTGPNAYGMTAAWGQTNTGQANNTLINNGTVTTGGSNARAASILGQNGVVINTGTLRTTGANAPTVYMQGNNDQLTNSGIIHASGSGSAGVFSNTAGSGFTATIENLPGGQIISDQDAAVRTLNGATTVTNAGLIDGRSGVALNGGGGNVTFILKTGSRINGLADGGSGANAVRLQGTGNITNPFTNFQTLVMEGTDWTWSGSGTFADTFIDSGALRLQTSLTGNVAIAAGTSLLAGNGANPSITPYPGGPAITVTNAGLIDLTNGGSPAANSLTIVGNYVGAGGQLHLQSALGTDNSPSDRLVISGGTASGTTSMMVTNAGGAGGLTTGNGILLVQTTNGATTATNAFALNGGSVMAGAYQYYLFHGGVTAGSEHNWYLRSTVLPNPEPTPSNPTPEPPVAAPNTPALPPPPAAGADPIPLYRPEVALYAAAPLVARQLGLLTIGTFHDRQGDQSLLTDANTRSGAWARAFGQSTRQQWSGQVSPSFNGSLFGLQSGVDLYAWADPSGHQDRLGFFAAYGRASGSVRGFAGGFENAPVGSLGIDATSIGAYWTHIGPSGWYIDAVAMQSWYNGSPSSITGLSARGEGTGQTLSLEGSYPIALGANLTLEPELQIIYQRTDLDDTRDLVSTVTYGASDAFTGRVGGRLQGNFPNGSTLLQPFLKANVWHTFSGYDSVTFAGTDIIGTRRMTTALELGGGVVARVSKTVGLFAAASYMTSLDNRQRETIQGNLGLRVSW